MGGTPKNVLALCGLQDKPKAGFEARGEKGGKQRAGKELIRIEKEGGE